MANLVQDLIDKKNKDQAIKLEDINRELIIALFAVSIYGKEARDEDILTVIIGDNKKDPIAEMKKNIEQRKKNGEKFKKGKDGYMRDTEGFIQMKLLV